jgi:predicted ATPase with chaperone activity
MIGRIVLVAFVNSLNSCNRIDVTLDQTVMAPVRVPGHLASSPAMLGRGSMDVHVCHASEK